MLLVVQAVMIMIQQDKNYNEFVNVTLKTFFKQFLVDPTGITENWVNIKAILERKDKHSNMS